MNYQSENLRRRSFYLAVQSKKIFARSYSAEKNHEKRTLLYGILRIFGILILRWRFFDPAAKSKKYLFNRIALTKSRKINPILYSFMKFHL